MPQQNCEAVFENGVLRPLGNLQLNEGQCVKLTIESNSISQLTSPKWSETGIIAQLTANPIKIEYFHPLTREEANERW
ncbi:antitoxin family protein [Microcystis aeruginosa CS-563/04]|uniref:antitoxin family protein n=1 Tax=Microcystis aeruginosa TaxID=1126 RepID=UPI00232B7A60|nr:antitoxin family protein [Microcystis aeruginosa]MDB9421678.1 antitoxin family protein [Microcystis aeruginosa CS-563/04]